MYSLEEIWRHTIYVYTASSFLFDLEVSIQAEMIKDKELGVFILKEIMTDTEVYKATVCKICNCAAADVHFNVSSVRTVTMKVQYKLYIYLDKDIFQQPTSNLVRLDLGYITLDQGR